MKAQEIEKTPILSPLINALPSAVLVVDSGHHILLANAAAEAFFDQGIAALMEKPLAAIIGAKSNLPALVEKVLKGGNLIKEYDHLLPMPRGQAVLVNLQLTPLSTEANEASQQVLIVIDPQGMVSKLTSHINQRDVMKSAGLMAAILAHEVKNPLSGIRGAAQLLADAVGEEDKKLTDLICGEVDRIKGLLTQLDIFSDESQKSLQPLNIHEVLQYVIAAAKAGFASHTEIIERYDPSLPPVMGNRELLVQLFMNLVKNAAEAVKESETKQITLSTSYQSGYRFKRGEDYISLPINILVQDTGSGVPQQLKSSLFDPFVTSKKGGKGLGLAIVSKIVADHGGVIELDDEHPDLTGFRILLPTAKVKPL